MKLKHITKPQLIDFLRWLDKNRHIHPFRIRYSSFRSKKVMLQEFSKFYFGEFPNQLVFLVVQSILLKSVG